MGLLVFAAPVIAALGEHPDAASIVTSAVTQLLGHGVLAVA